jgi:hypothetical protein
MPPPLRSADAATRRTSAPAAAVAVASLALALSSCAAAPAMSEANAPERPLPSDVEGTVALLDESEAELLGALGPAPDPTATPGGAGADAAAPAQEPRPLAKAETVAAGSPPVVEEEGDVARDPCAIACRALSSMQRAAQHLCGLTGEQDSRCGSARARAASAAQRVREACPRCGA